MASALDTFAKLWFGIYKVQTIPRALASLAIIRIWAPHLNHTFLMLLCAFAARSVVKWAEKQQVSWTLELDQVTGGEYWPVYPKQTDSKHLTSNSSSHDKQETSRAEASLFILCEWILFDLMSGRPVLAGLSIATSHDERRTKHRHVCHLLLDLKREPQNLALELCCRNTPRWENDSFMTGTRVVKLCYV